MLTATLLGPSHLCQYPLRMIRVGSASHAQCLLSWEGAVFKHLLRAFAADSLWTCIPCLMLVVQCWGCNRIR